MELTGQSNTVHIELSEEDKKIQKELNARIAGHKLLVVNTYIQQQYLDAEKLSPIVLPDVIAEKNAKEFSQRLTAQYLLNGILEQEYNKSWFYLAEQLP